MKVSIVIPHFNNYELLFKCLKALNNQSVPRKEYEIIVIDNGSVDLDFDAIIPLCDVIKISNVYRDPYYCRNIGIKLAKCKFIALIDAKCVPDYNWLSIGLKSLGEGNELVSGKIEVAYSSDFYQRAYGIIYLDNFHLNKIKAGFPTGNLFLNKSLFTRFGYFNNSVRSGEDIRWTKNVIVNFIQFCYQPKAIVIYNSKSKLETLTAAYRDGEGFKKNGGKLKYTHFLPMNPKIVKEKISRIKIPFSLFEKCFIHFYIFRVKWQFIKGYYKFT